MAQPPMIKKNFHFPDLFSDETKRTRWILRAVSLVFAVLLWLFVSWDGTALGTREIRVPLKYDGLLDGYSISSATREINVTVEGRFELLALFNRDSITASVGVRDLEQGRYRLPVQINLPEFMRLVSHTPQTVELELFRIVERTVRPRLQIRDDLPEGYSPGEVRTTPGEVTLRGPESAVTAVLRAELHGTFAELRDGGARDLPVVLMGEAGEIKGVTVEPRRVKVTARFTETEEEKAVPIRVEAAGYPAGTLELSSVTVSPDVVTLRGPRSALQTISEIRLDAIDVSGLSEDMELEFPLSAPGSGVTVAGPPYAQVRVEFRSAVERHTFLDVPIAVLGRGIYKNWNLTPSRASVTIEWSAVPGMTVDRIAPPFEAYVDVTNVISRELSLPLLVKDLPLGIKVIRVEPEQIVVRAIVD